MERLVWFGCSHRQVPPSQLRGWYQRRGGILAQLVEAQRARRIAGAVLLTTCHRIEVVLDLPAAREGQAAELAAEVLPGDLPRPMLRGRAAVEHLLQVAVGLDSLAPGEDQILGQVRRAFCAAGEHGLSSPRLRALQSRLIAAAREIRAAAGLQRLGISLAAHAALHLRAAGPRLVIVGIGESGRRAAVAAHRDGAELVLVNRTQGRAQRLAAQLGSRVLGLQAFLADPPAADGLLLAVHGGTVLLAPEHAPRYRRIVDLSMPSVLPAAVRTLPEVLDLDRGARLIARRDERLDAALAAARELVAARAVTLEAALSARGDALGGVIERHLESARSCVEQALAHGLRHLPAVDAERVRQLVLRSAKRHAHFHLEDLKQQDLRQGHLEQGVSP